MIKRELKRFAGIIMLAVIAISAVSLWMGWIELSFLMRGEPVEIPAETSVQPLEPTESTIEETHNNTEESVGTDTSEAQPSETETDADELNHDEIIARSRPKLTSGVSVRFTAKRLNWDMSDFKFDTAASLAAKKYTLSDQVFNAETDKITTVNAPFKLSTVRSSSNKTVEKAIKTKVNFHSETVISYTKTETARLTLEPYMGYVIYDHDGKLYLLDSNGKGLFTYNYNDYYPAYTRDAEGNPLFYKNTGSGIASVGTDVSGDISYNNNGKKYYRVSDDKKGFTESAYVDEVENRGLYFDYPAWYGTADNDIVRLAYLDTVITENLDNTVTETTRANFAYGYSKNYRLTGYNFISALNFREGYAAVQGKDGNAYFINQSGYASFTYTKTFKNNSDRYVIMRLKMPMTNGIESLGFFYFDHGLVRIREQNIDNYSFVYKNGEIYVIIDEDYLIYEDGTRFPIPTGYNLVSYSDGVALLEADGKYGYYDYTGAWIAQPVYSYAAPFVEGLAALGFTENSIGMIDTNGNVVLPFKYSSVSNCSSGVITAFSNSEGWTIFNKMKLS